MLELYKDRKPPPRFYRPDEADYAPPSVRVALLRLAKTPEDTWDAHRRHFYAMVSNLDRNVGRISGGCGAARRRRPDDRGYYQ